MMNRIVDFSIQNRVLIILAALLFVVGGIYAAITLPIDAVPDISPKQVVINTYAPALGPEDIERLITSPIEVSLAGLPRLQDLRSISQFGLSQVTAVFDDGADIYFARQIVNERLNEAKEQLPPGADPPRLAPISTGLGEIYYIFVEVGQAVSLPGSSDRQANSLPHYSLMERRTILDWQVKPRLRTVSGIIEVNSFGGHVKQYQVLADPERLRAYGLTLGELREALEKNNRNAGGAYVAKQDEQQIVQGIGMVRSLDDIRDIVLTAERGAPVLVRDVARVEFGPALRQGSITKDGKGEAVAAICVMLMGENSRTVTQRVKERVAEIQKEVPPGIKLVGFLDRTSLVNDTLHTAGKNLLEGGVLVILVLFLFLLQLRAGLIVSSIIPLAMLVAIIGMKYYGVSANLMSLGAIDFGLIVDAAVIIVENCVRRLAEERQALGRALTQEERLRTVREATVQVRSASQFGEMIIIAAYIPILSLIGVEGKMFRPMGFTVIFALVGALVLSLTLIPALCAAFLKEGSDRENPVVAWLQHRYLPLLRRAVRYRYATVGGALVLFVLCASLFPRLGSEFIPKLDEGAICINPGYLPGISVDTAMKRATLAERVILKKFPNEVESAVTRIGRPDIATDPMLLSQHDIFLPLKPRSQWKEATTKAELIAKMEAEILKIPGLKISFTQPVEMRMTEMSEGLGVRSEVGAKVFGPDMPVLRQKATEVADVLRGTRGGQDISVEATEGLPLLQIRIRRDQIARYGVNVADVQEVIETAIGGQRVGEVIDGNRRFDIVLRYDLPYRQDAEAIRRLLVTMPDGQRIPLTQIAELVESEGPIQVGREAGERRVVVQANVRGRDLGGFVEEAKAKVVRQVKLAPGYHVEWGGQYEHLQEGMARLMVVVPITFFIIFLLLYITYGRVLDAARVFTGIPFAISGGILALYLRGMPFSISAGVGFIALSGVAVLADMVMVQYIRYNLDRGMPLMAAIEDAAVTRLRPVLMTAAVAAIGFLPMALSTGKGAEVQKPLATVVIGGLITATALTLFVLPALYTLVSGRRKAPTTGAGVERERDNGRDGHPEIAPEALVPGGARS